MNAGAASSGGSPAVGAGCVGEGVCPLCGGANGCGMASAEPQKGPCWCMVVEMPEPVLRRVPEALRGRACVCHACVAEERRREGWMPRARAGEFYFTQDGRMAFTARYHLRRGYCCGSGCRHCPYDGSGRPRREVLEALT